MNRRNLLKTAGAVGAVGVLAGCTYDGTDTGKFKIRDLGLVKKHESAAAYVTLENVHDEEVEVEVTLASYDPDGVRVSDWVYVSGDFLQPGEQRSVYAVWDAESVGWFNANNLGQVLQSHSAKVRATDDYTDPKGPILGDESIGKTIEEAQQDNK